MFVTVTTGCFNCFWALRSWKEQENVLYKLDWKEEQNEKREYETSDRGRAWWGC